MKSVKFLSLFLPLILSYFLISNPIGSYTIAWLGSFFLFYLSLTGFIAPLPDDLPISEQLMRPVFVIQVIFCGFNFCSSIFYFLDSLGMQDFKWRPNYYVDMVKVAKIAEAQRNYLLGHIFLLLGMFSKDISKYKRSYKVKDDIDWSIFLILITFFAFTIGFVAKFIPGFSQVSQQFNGICFLSGTYAFCYAIIKKDKTLIVVAGGFYAYSFITAMVSGFKEPIIISLLLVCVFMYPYYKKLVMLASVPLIYVCFFIIPAYVSSFRSLANNEDNTQSLSEIRDQALDAALEKKESNWEFLTGRLSEIGMFTTYIESTPKTIPYYGTKLIEQSLIVLVPRIAWKNKPVTEAMVMERVIKAGVVSDVAKVSAKPMYIVDGYLSGGLFGIMLSLFCYGFSVQWVCSLAEKWFGGYFLGTAIIFNGLFGIFWRGLSFEFILNTVGYSILTMYVIQRILYSYGFLEKIHEDPAHNAIV